MNEIITKAVLYVQNLSPMALWFIMIIALLLFVYLAYKVMGLGGALGILVLIFFAYVLYSNDTFTKYREKERNEEQRTLQLDKELQKDSGKD